MIMHEKHGLIPMLFFFISEVSLLNRRLPNLENALEKSKKDLEDTVNREQQIAEEVSRLQIRIDCILRIVEGVQAGFYRKKKKFNHCHTHRKYLEIIFFPS